MAERIRVAVVGAGGRMGSTTVEAVRGCAGMELVGEIERCPDPRPALEEARPEVVVDFSIPEVVERHLELYLDLGIRPVVGTTGLSESAFARLASVARERRIGGVVAPNFAIGAVLMIELAAQVAQHMESVEIIEFHHPAKLDAPSGTAVKTAHRIRSANPSIDDVPTHSVRLPGFLAHQEVIFGGSGERLTLRHDTIDRGCFMPGVLMSIRKVREIDELLYGLEHFLKS